MRLDKMEDLTKVKEMFSHPGWAVYISWLEANRNEYYTMQMTRELDAVKLADISGMQKGLLKALSIGKEVEDELQKGEINK